MIRQIARRLQKAYDEGLMILLWIWCFIPVFANSLFSGSFLNYKL